MSLEQNTKKIKSLIQLIIGFQVILAMYFYMHIYSTYNRGEDIEFVFGHFETGFLREGLEKTQTPTSVANKDFYITASINGIRYYYAHCSGVGRINVENRIYFGSEMAAEEAGYTLAQNCKK